MDDKYDQYEPTEEEWTEIEEAILKEEEEERHESEKKDKKELATLKIWLKEHGMLWDIKSV
jgi:hypothetical protein